MDDRKAPSPLRHLWMVLGFGIAMVFTILTGLIAGVYLDRKLGTSPTFTLIFLILGILSGGWIIFKEILREFKRESGNQ